MRREASQSCQIISCETFFGAIGPDEYPFNWRKIVVSFMCIIGKISARLHNVRVLKLSA